MSKLTRLQTKLARIDARLAEIEAAFPTIVKYAGHAAGQGQTSTQFQQFGPVALEYTRLLTEKDAIEDAIAEYSGEENGNCGVAAFRGVT